MLDSVQVRVKFFFIVIWTGWQRRLEHTRVVLVPKGARTHKKYRPHYRRERERERKVRKRQGRIKINRQVVQGAVVVKRKIRQGGQVGRNTDKPAEFVSGLRYTQQHVTKDVHINKRLWVGEGCNETRLKMEIYFQ